MSDVECFQIVVHENATEIRLQDANAMDAAVQHRLVDELVAYVQREQPENLVINFANVHRCATVAINGLLAVRRILGMDRTRLKLCHVRDEVYETLTVLSLAGSVFEIHDTLDDAIAAR